jgi:tetratricopeptide (TPR) repeat protein
MELVRTGDWTINLARQAELQRAVAIDPGFSHAHAYIATFWLNQLSPASSAFGQTDLPPDEVRGRFEQSIEVAIAGAGSEAERLQYQALQARARLQLADQVTLLRRATELSPADADGWRYLGDALVQAGRYPEAREALLKSAELGRGTARELINTTARLHRVDPEAAVPLVERALVQPDFGLWDLYQAHRAFLHAGRVEQAAELARSHALRAGGTQNDYIVQLRQACAEGRVSDAEVIFAGTDEHESNRWLLLKTLGRDDEAREFVRPLDTPDQLFSLASFLDYPFFDAGDYPLLADTLARQGIQRPKRRLPFACKR